MWDQKLTKHIILKLLLRFIYRLYCYNTDTCTCLARHKDRIYLLKIWAFSIATEWHTACDANRRPSMGAWLHTRHARPTYSGTKLKYKYLINIWNSSHTLTVYNGRPLKDSRTIRQRTLLEGSRRVHRLSEYTGCALLSTN